MNKYLCKSTGKQGIQQYLNAQKLKINNDFDFCVTFLEQIYPNLHSKKLNWPRVAELVQNNFKMFKEYVKNQ